MSSPAHHLPLATPTGPFDIFAKKKKNSFFFFAVSTFVHNDYGQVIKTSVHT